MVLASSMVSLRRVRGVDRSNRIKCPPVQLAVPTTKIPEEQSTYKGINTALGIGLEAPLAKLRIEGRICLCID